MAQGEKYNLQRLLEMRERAREQAALHLSECRRQLITAENELKVRKQAVVNCRKAQQETQSQMFEKSGGGIKTAEIAGFRQHLADLRENEIKLLASVEEQKRTVERAEKTVEKALSALAETARETKVIEKHRENWQAEKKTESDRRESKSNDEIGAILHERNKFE